MKGLLSQRLIFYFILVSIFGFSACDLSQSSQSNVASLDETDALEQVGTIEIQETDDRFIGHFENADVALSPLRLFVADLQMHRIAVVNRDGDIERFIGEHGEGPGELQTPVNVAVFGERVTIRNADTNDYAVFDTTGTFRERNRLPDDHWIEGPHAIVSDSEGYVLPITDIDPRDVGGVQATPDQSTVARLDTTFAIEETFGSFPKLYLGGEYVWRERSIDVSADSLAAVGYRLLPDVYIYDLAETPTTRAHELVLDHPDFKRPSKEIPMELAVQDRDAYEERVSNVSSVRHTYLLGDSVVVQTFNNRTEAYYQEDFPEEERDHYAILGRIDSDEQKHLDLPGRVFARDAEDRLYIELNHVPDEREIGIYEVNWP